MTATKRFHDGTHRVMPPAETLARVMPFAARAGITRVAMLTGLDTIGIPVAAAIRPNSRSIAQHQGKGATPEAARASAVMEAIETWHAENVARPLRLAAFDELPGALPPDLLPLSPGGAALGRALRAERLLWVEGATLGGGTPAWVPLELVSADFTHDAPARFQATTNGLAAGNVWLEAVLHGLYEAVERDAVARWRAAPAAVQDATAVDLATVAPPSLRHLLARFAQAGMELRLWEVTSEVRLPAFLCLVQARDAADGVEPQLGAGCHASREVACARALTEAAQARAAVISGGRDDFTAEGYGAAARARQRTIAAHWLRAPARRAFAAAPDCAADDLEADLATTLAALDAAGCGGAAWVDLSRPEVGIPVVRVIVPGLAGPWTPEGGDHVPRMRR